MKSWFEKILWWLLVVWAIVGAFSFYAGWYQQPPTDWVGYSPEVLNVFNFFMQRGDVIFMGLACANAVIVLFKTLSSRDAVKTILIISLVSMVIEGIGVLTGYPFGRYVYNDTFGAKVFGIVPFTIAMAWLVVVSMSYFVVMKFFPKLSKLKVSVISALLVTMIDVVLEPFAYDVRGYWTWAEGIPPFQNYISWFVCALIFNLWAPMYLDKKSESFMNNKKPLGILFLMIAVFVIGRYVQ